jgi:hypothetical protein
MQYDLKPMDFIESYRITVDKINEFHPDLFFANADRVEMCGATAAAFHNKVKIAHYQAGVVNDPITTFDDVDRHVITLWSDIQFVETEVDGHVVADLKGVYISDSWDHKRQLKSAGIHVVGITHLDDLEVDESKVPVSGIGDFHESDICTWSYEPYDLFLYNRPTIIAGDEIFYLGVEMGNTKLEKRMIVLIGGNPDDETIIPDGVDVYYPTLPRPQFLGLLKNCQRFITNSSCAITEAPYFLKPEQIVMVGDRNRNRPPVECVPGGSDLIVAILKEYAKKG